MTEPTPIGTLVYTSIASEPFGAAELFALLDTSRRNNGRDGLTGLLLHHAGRFIQVLEGPASAVHARMAVIVADGRHRKVRVLVDEESAARQFPEWTMGFPSDVAVDAHDVGDVPGFLGTFSDIEADTGSSVRVPELRALIRWFEHRARATGERE
ncbi:BLUF domain-containing protein [Herbiconiux sp. A18JL235]|uniref:BLUF domain-containing protein n=1 Tax=Herbiconiux sp. A18JL235 TaxID=3152363 RepID=A0AB39BKD9_9MICO